MVELRDNKEQFKNTEVGTIPEDWHVINFGETSNIKARIGWQGLTTKEYRTSGDYYLITGTDFTNNRIKWESCFFVDKYRYLQDSNIQIKDGDVLITKDGTIGKVAYIENMKKPATLNSGVFVVRPINESYNPKFLFYILNSFYFEKFLKQLSAGSTISHLYQKDIVKFNFPCPSKKEQDAIASALSDMDDLILSIEKLINKKKLIKQGTMQALLTGKKRLKAFNNRWTCVTYQMLFDKISVKANQINSNEYLSIGKFPVIDQGKQLIVAYSDNINKVFKCNNEGVIVFGDHTREVKYIDFDFIIGADGTQVLKSKKEYNSKFIYYLLKNKDIPNTGYNRHFKFIKEMKFIIPPSIEEQVAIANILSDMDKDIEKLDERLNKYKQIKIGMMEELLTGKRRLV